MATTSSAARKATRFRQSPAGIPIFLATVLAWSAAPPIRSATALESSAQVWAELEAAIEARGVDPAKVAIPGRLTDEMKRWVREQVAPGASHERTLRLLLSALIDPQGLKLVYDPSFTGTAEEVFTTRRANCLGFTHLFVGMARELGVPTYYVRWSLVEEFRREGDLVVVSGHVSAGYGPPTSRHVLEFGAVYDLEVETSRPISDLNATARHYANRSAELLREGRLPEAAEAAELSVQLDPNLADGWVNLGVCRRRLGDQQGAEEAYRFATLVDPDHLAAYHNLSVLRALQGKKDSAREILALLDRRDNRNPYIYLALGDESLKTGRVAEAGRYYRRASRLGPGLAETRAARGSYELRQGEVEKAWKWLRKAQRRNPDDRRTRELAEALSRLEQGSE